MINIRYLMLFIFFLSLISTLILTKLFIYRAIKRNLVVKDMYKKGNQLIPHIGGLAILGGIIVSMIILQFVGINMIPLLLFYFVIILYAIYGLADDILSFNNRIIKVLVLFFFALPISILTSDTNLDLIFFNLELGLFYAFILIDVLMIIIGLF